MTRAVETPVTERLAPFRVGPSFSQRVWGRRNLEPWYPVADLGGPIGEAWLSGPASVAETGVCAGKTLSEIAAEWQGELLGDGAANQAADFPLLVKMIFPQEMLSIQVHPDDMCAQALGQPRGKTECWYVLEAEPGAAVALGLREGTTAEHVLAAISNGSMEALMQWVPVSVGDMLFVEAGTVHAIGPGMVLLETQQTSETTFRLYDYGRGRELHLDRGLSVMKARTSAGRVAPRAMPGFTRLIEERHFVVDRYDVAAGQSVAIPGGVPGCLVCLKGTATVHRGADEPIEMLPGRAVIVPAAVECVTVETAAAALFVRCFAPRFK